MSVFLDIENNLQNVLQKSSLSNYQKTFIINKLTKINVNTAGQLLSFVPVDYEHRDELVLLSNACQNEKVLVKVRVVQHKKVVLPRRGVVWQIIVEDDSAHAELHCYGRAFLKDVMPINSEHYIWGKFALKYRKIISSSFEVVSLSHRKGNIVARYRLPTGSISANMFSLAMRACITNTTIEDLHNYHSFCEQNVCDDVLHITRAEACRMLHFPKSDDEIKHARSYFAIDEMLLFQVSVQYAHRNSKKQELEKMQSENKTSPEQGTLNFNNNNNNNKPQKNKNYLHTLVNDLPFTLTKGQREVITEIVEDMKGGLPMRRLLQGDVGSGKTLVALCTAMHVLEQGKQVCLIVPSEALALQHYRNIKKLCEKLGINIVCLTGSTKASEKKYILADIKSGQAQCIIGTHAIYSEGVEYNNLFYAIIDEQHRFGIAQRSQLLGKSKFMHALLMSATPIPRSLALTLYSGVDISTLKERPAMRKDIHTRIVLLHKVRQVYERVKNRLHSGEQAFFVFPQIEQTITDEEEKKSFAQKQTLLSAEETFPEIQQALAPHKVALLHSKVNESERVHILEQFAEGKITALVCTTIIEVGIDVPNANVMCIFDAQRFGLSTLHQLRGRVGRGESEAETILIYRKPLSDIAKERLKVIYENTDGFVIAEKDLILRGPGDVNHMGSRQSGSLLFEFTDLESDIHLLQQLNVCAQNILDKDENLNKEEHLRLKYYLKGYAASV